MTTDRLTDDEARGMLVRAAQACANMLRDVRAAIERVNKEEANSIHALRLSAQFKDITKRGVLSDNEVLKVHPLYPLLNLAAKLSASIERILSITNPNMMAERKLAELRAAREFRLAD